METNFITDLLLPLSLFIIMLGMGMTLTISDFKQVVLFPKAVLLGLVGQMIMLPLIGFVLVKLFNVDAMIAVGVMIIAACPGGTTSNLISHLAKGDTALSITLTAISSLLTVITIPLVIGLSMSLFLSADQNIELPFIKTITTLIVITLLPVGLGMLINKNFSQLAQKQERWVKVFSGLFLAFLIVMIIWQQSDAVIKGIIDIGLVVLCLNIISMLSGFIVSYLAGLNNRQTTTITIEIGLQNGTLAILIATTILHVPELAIPAAIYSLTMFITGASVIFFRHNQKN